MSARKTQRDYEDLAANKGGKFVGPLPSGVREYTEWECGHGHVFSNAYFNLAKVKGNPCDECSDQSRRKSEKHYHKLAERTEVSWIGKQLPKRTTDLTDWLCENGHEFRAAFDSLKKSNYSGCAHCSGKAQKTDEDYHNLATERRLKWLGPHPGSVHSVTNWQCLKGHLVDTSFHVLQRAPDNGCEQCSRMAKKTRADYQALAKEREMFWLGKELPQDTKTPTEWQCLFCGNRWHATFGNICHQRSACPKCVDMEDGIRVSRPQRELAKMLNGKLNREWYGYRVDVTIEKAGVPIAIEYDSWHFHGNRQEDDEIRDKTLVTSGLKLLVIKSNTGLPTKGRLSGTIQELLAGKDRVEIQLPDWGEGITVEKRKHKRKNAQRKNKLPENCVGIPAKASECVAELDGMRLYIRRGREDLRRLLITSGEAAILNSALAQNDDKAGTLTFTYESVHNALDRLVGNDRATRALLYRLRNRVRFLEGEFVGLVSGMSKGHWQTTIRVRRRPNSRVSKDIQTKYGEWRSFQESRAFVRGLNLQSQIDWHRWAKTTQRPKDIPSNPQRAYRDHGWIDWADWLGKVKRTT